MKKKNKLKHYNKATKTIYPKQYVGYVILSLLIATFCIYLGYLIYRDSMTTDLSMIEIFLGIFLSAFLIFICFYHVTTIISLVLKQIKLQVIGAEIRMNRVFAKRKILITDIDSIRIGNATWKYPLSYVIIKRKKHGSKYSNRYLIFPVAWFSITDIRYILETASYYNKKINFNGISKLY